LHHFLHYNGIKALNKVIGDVNEVHKNQNVQWSLSMLWDIPTWITEYDFQDFYENINQNQNKKGQLIRDLMRSGKFTTRNMINGKSPRLYYL
jgi:hypothetical protein